MVLVAKEKFRLIREILQNCQTAMASPVCVVCGGVLDLSNEGGISDKSNYPLEKLKPDDGSCLSCAAGNKPVSVFCITGRAMNGRGMAF
jgi:hypothetical protein